MSVCLSIKSYGRDTGGRTKQLADLSYPASRRQQQQPPTSRGLTCGKHLTPFIRRQRTLISQQLSCLHHVTTMATEEEQQQSSSSLDDQRTVTSEPNLVFSLNEERVTVYNSCNLCFFFLGFVFPSVAFLLPFFFSYYSKYRHGNCEVVQR